MEMTLRWYGSKYDTVKLWQIRQVPGVKGVITTLYNKQAGELWEQDEIKALKNEVAAENMHIAGIESVNVSDAIKAATPDRDKHIDNYIKTLENLGKEDIHMVCYNFMPVFDWTRSELARKRPDGSTVLAYTQEAIDAIDPEKMFESLAGDTNGAVMPGWEPERMEHVKELFELYKGIDEEKLFENIVYFLKAIMPGALFCVPGSCDFSDEYICSGKAKLVCDNIKLYEAWAEEYPYPTYNQIYIPGCLWLDLVHDGKLSKDKIINLGAILAGKEEGRKSDDEVIIYSVGGMPVEDVAWGKKCYEKALELGIGTKLNLWEQPYLF